jgi:stage III sporulation protein SpoIIIAA
MLNLLNCLNVKVRNVVSRAGIALKEAVEIRLRINSPVMIKTSKRDLFLDEKIVITKKDIDDIVANFTKNSIQQGLYND